MDGLRAFRRILHVGVLLACVDICISQQNLTEGEKLTLYKQKMNGISLPDFAFFTREEQNSYRENMFNRTEKKRANKKRFVQTYNVTRASALARQLRQLLKTNSSSNSTIIANTTITSNSTITSSTNSSTTVDIEEEAVVEEIETKTENKTKGNRKGSRSRGNRKPISTKGSRIRNKLDSIKNTLGYIKHELALEEEIADMLLRSKRSPRTNTFEDYVHHIVRRETSEEVVCYEKGSETTNGNLRLCRVCAYKTTLSADKYPQYINEIKCDSTDTTCFCGEGSCFQKVMYAEFLQQADDGSYNQYTQAINNGCECEIAKGSVFETYLSG